MLGTLFPLAGTTSPPASQRALGSSPKFPRQSIPEETNVHTPLEFGGQSQKWPPLAENLVLSFFKKKKICIPVHNLPTCKTF